MIQKTFHIYIFNYNFQYKNITFNFTYVITTLILTRFHKTARTAILIPEC